MYTLALDFHMVVIVHIWETRKSIKFKRDKEEY